MLGHVKFFSFLYSDFPEINSILIFCGNIFFASKKCCLAKISVGAIRATWKPELIVLNADNNDTIVLPLPTSPVRV